MNSKQILNQEKLKTNFINLLKNRNVGIENDRNIGMRTSFVLSKSFDSTKDYSWYIEKVLFTSRSSYGLDAKLENLLLTFFLQTTPDDFKKYYLPNNLTKEKEYDYDKKMKSLINSLCNNKWDTKKEYLMTLLTHGLLLSRKNFIKDFVLPNLNVLNNSQKLTIFDKAISLGANDNIDVHTVLNTLLNNVTNTKEVEERRGLLTNIIYINLDENLFDAEMQYKTYKLMYSIVKLNSINLNKKYNVSELKHSFSRLAKEFEKFHIDFGLKDMEGVEVINNDRILSVSFNGNDIKTELIKKVFEKSLKEILLLNEVSYDHDTYNRIIDKHNKIENSIIIKDSIDDISLLKGHTKIKI